MKLASLLMRTVSAIIALCSLAVIVLLVQTLAPTAMSFSFTWYSLVYVFCTAIYAILLLPLRTNRNRLTFWFGVYISASIILMFSGLIISSAPDIAAYTFWYRTFAFVTILSVLSNFFFTVAYTGYEEYLYRPLSWVTIFGSAMLIASADTATNLFNNTQAAVRSDIWGYSPFPLPGKYYALYVLWLEIFLVAAIILLIRHYHKVKINVRKRRQTLIVVVATSLPAVLGTLTIAVLPALTGKHNPPPLLVVYSAIQASLIGYAIFRYKVFDIEPAALSATVLGTMNESVLAINSYGEIAHINPTAAKMLGVKTETVLSQTLHEVFSAETVKLINQKVASDHTDAIELDITTPSGTIPISLLASKLASGGGASAGAILVFRDITKERAIKAEIEQQVVERTSELHEEQAKLRASIEGLVLGFVLVDRHDKIVIQNQMLQTIFAAEKPFTDMEQLEERLQSFDLAVARKNVRESGDPMEVKEVNLDSKILRLELSPVKVTEGKITTTIGTVILVEDITEAKVMARSKDEFFSIASHELRTPLTAILGNASMIIDYHPDVVKDPDVKDMVYDIHDASDRLIAIVSDFMDASGLEQGKVVFRAEEFALGPVVETVVYEMRTILEQKKLSLEVEPKTLGTLPPIWADKGRTKQILYNLVGNALKFTEKGGASITIALEDDHMKIVVSDTGRGISVENQKLLFHKLQQASDSLLTRDTTRGTGLGLYICKVLAERMGGTIALERSSPDKGSTFVVTLPLATEQLRKQATAAPVAQTDIATGLSA